MQKLSWDNSLSLGVEEIDDQHKHLFSLFHKLCSAMHDGQADENMLRQHIEDLKDYASTHFRDEENLMNRSNYPDLENHIEEHAELSARLVHLEAMLDAKEPRLALDLANYSRRWLISHVKGSDFKCAQFLRARERRAGQG